MKPFFNLIVVIPIGPNAAVDFICDTIQSVLFGTSRETKFILLDDSQQDRAIEVQAAFPGSDIVKTSKNLGGWCGLYVALSHAYAYALSRYTFNALLKLDTDALVIGKAPEEQAIKLFRENQTIGMAGQYPNEYDGKPWDIAWPRQRILNGTSSWKFIRRPFENWILRKLYNRALKNGYKTGESVFGGAYFMSYDCLLELKNQGLLPHPNLKALNLGEDHLFSLMVKAIGLNLGDLSSGSLPFGCSWKGLPDSPEVLLHKGKKIIHSTRGWKHMEEVDIRHYFKIRRELA